MKKEIVFLMALLLGVFSTCQMTYCQDSRIEDKYIKKDSANLAILVLDFLTYKFLEANISYYPSCENCDSDSLPFDIEFIEPSDEGEIIYKYTHNDDTLFHGLITWGKHPEILYPGHFLPADSFMYIPNSILLPENVQYFDYWLIPTFYSQERYIEMADSAWLSVDSLEIIYEYAKYPFRVGIYAYTWSVGIFQPEAANWIIFLFYNDFSSGISENKVEESSIQFYPNPSKGLLYFKNDFRNTDKPFKVTDLTGKLVYQGNITNDPVNLTDLNNGLYILKVWTGEKYVSGKIIISK